MAAAALLTACAIGLALHPPRREPVDLQVVADRIVLYKAERQMTLFRGEQPIKTYAVSLGFGEPGPKTREGDGRTPEGLYHISGRNPHSDYHLSLRISYPDADDVAAAQALGVSPGGDIMIHGARNGLGWLGGFLQGTDWTAGCIAVTNGEMDEIWRTVPDGTPIEILP